MENSTYNETILALCPHLSNAENNMISNTAFWLDGVAKTLVAVLGVASNILAGYVLCKPNMKNSFNLCLVALAVIDTIFLLGSILQSIRKRYVNIILQGNIFYDGNFLEGIIQCSDFNCVKVTMMSKMMSTVLNA